MSQLAISIKIALLIGVFLTISDRAESSDLPLNRDLDKSLNLRTLSELELRLVEIDAELEQLAQLSLRSGNGAIGYRSRRTKDPHQAEWVEVDLGEEVSIDEIVLVPTLMRNSTQGFQADGFPLDFRIIAGSQSNKQGTVIASFTEQDDLFPRIAPLIVPCQGTMASWIRIETTQLTRRGIDGYYSLQLAELLVFNGSKNCALRRPVTSTSPSPYPIYAWGERYLTDGAVPYLMDSSSEKKGAAFLSGIGEADQPTFTIDLEEPHVISQINLHAVDQSDTVPQAFLGDLGIPRHLRIEGAMQADFSDAVQLLDAQCEHIYEMSPIMSWNIPETSCRFVRLIAVAPYIFDNGLDKGSRTGFAEIELISEGSNVALGKSASTNLQINPKDNLHTLSKLTDGLNFYGNILPIREWMNQLTQRHDWETERPIITAELNRRYTKQKTNLIRVSWLAAILAVVIVITILIDRMIRMRHIAQIRERFAADLHDELGADLHSIGLLSDLAHDAMDNRPKLTKLLNYIRTATEVTGSAVQHCSSIQSGEISTISLNKEIERIAERVVVHLKHNLQIDGDAHLLRLKPRTRSDLFLFYKECLVNVCRHSEATHLSTHLIATKSQIKLTVTDNGQGLSNLSNTSPRSLKRRARLMGARLSVNSSVDGGTCIILKLRTKRRFLQMLPSLN